MTEMENLQRALTMLPNVCDAFLYFSFTGALLSLKNRKYINRILRAVNVLVVSPCVIMKEIEDFKPDIKKVERRLPMSEFINRLGECIGNDNSCLYVAWRFNIPVFCPIIEGRLAYFLIENNFNINIISDIKKINFSGVFKERTAAIVFGTGMVKHHVLNANLFSDGLDYLILVNSAVEYDGSDSGARPEEAISWGKIGIEKESVKISCCPSLLLESISSHIK